MTERTLVPVPEGSDFCKMCSAQIPSFPQLLTAETQCWAGSRLARSEFVSGKYGVYGDGIRVYPSLDVRIVLSCAHSPFRCHFQLCNAANAVTTESFAVNESPPTS